MIHDRNSERGDLIERFLDDLLTEEERAGFERGLRDDDELRSEMEFQDAIDASISRIYQPPPMNELPIAVSRACGLDGADRQPVVRQVGFFRRFAIAAALVLGVTGVWLTWSALRPAAAPIGPYAAGPMQSFEVAYAAKVDAGLVPEWVCDTEEEFADAFRGRFAQALVLDAPADVNALGLASCNTITRKTLCLLATRDDAAVIVFVDRAARDTPPDLSPESGLHAYRAVIGKLVLYEVSPFDSPILLDRFRDPDQGGEREDG